MFNFLKKIKNETPSDPFEAELLMMAGIVADNQKNESSSSSDSENDISNNGNYFIDIFILKILILLFIRYFF